LHTAPRPKRDIAGVIARMEGIQARLDPADARRHFHTTYLRTTYAVDEEINKGGFLDPAWLEEWDAVFADLYLDAFEAWERGDAPGAWEVPFAAARDQPGLQAVRHVLFGMNVHINFDLPQALLAVITDEEFDDPAVRENRGRDHEHIDAVLVRRVAAEDRALPGRRLIDRIMAPLNRRATKRFLREAREKVWRNAVALSRARRKEPEELARRIDELDRLCAARVKDLTEPGFVVLKLGRNGFGVLLPDA
jgi:uncharacterized protein DUF5995